MTRSITRAEALALNEACWDRIAERFYGRTALPEYGPHCATEDELGLLGDLTGAAVLELGCGSGHSLRYLRDERGATELWGLDLSQVQLDLAQKLLGEHAIRPRLVKGSMDENPGLPEGRFAAVIAIYSLGWTPNLEATLAWVSAYLKNAAAAAGLIIERVIESEPNAARVRQKDLKPGGYYSLPKAELVPATFVVRCRKPGAAEADSLRAALQQHQTE